MRKRHHVSFEEQLASVPLLAALSEVQLEAMAARATRAREPRGMIFSKEGERGDELVVILEGEVQVRRADQILATLGPGEFVGEMALLDDASRRTATVIAQTPVVVAYIGRHDFDALLADAPEVAATIRETIAARAHHDERPRDDTA